METKDECERKDKRSLNIEAKSSAETPFIKKNESYKSSKRSSIESVRRGIGGDDFHQSVDQVYDEVSLLGFESSSLVETDCQVNSIAKTNSKTTKFLNCKTSTPTANERAKNITDSELDLSSIDWNPNQSDSSLFLNERPISRLQFSDEFIQTSGEEFLNSYKFEYSIDIQTNEENHTIHNK